MESEKLLISTDGNGNPIDLPFTIDGKMSIRLISEIVEEFGDSAPAMILEGFKTLAKHDIKIEYGTLLVKLMGNPTREERDTWERQRDWAVRHNNNDTTATPLLLGLLTEDERTALGDNAPDVMANSILTKNAGAEKLISLAGGIRRTAEKAIEAAKTPEEVGQAVEAAEEKAKQAVASIQG